MFQPVEVNDCKFVIACVLNPISHLWRDWTELDKVFSKDLKELTRLNSQARSP